MTDSFLPCPCLRVNRVSIAVIGAHVASALDTLAPSAFAAHARWNFESPRNMLRRPGRGCECSGQRALTLRHCCFCTRGQDCPVSGKQYQSSKAMKSPPIWQKFEVNEKTRENGARKAVPLELRTGAPLVHRGRRKRGLPGTSAATEARPTCTAGLQQSFFDWCGLILRLGARCGRCARCFSRL